MYEDTKEAIGEAIENFAKDPSFKALFLLLPSNPSPKAQTEALPYVSVILDDLKISLQYSVTTTDEDEGGSRMDAELEWQLPYHPITVLAKILRVFPTFANEDDRIFLSLISSFLMHGSVLHHAGFWVFYSPQSLPPYHRQISPTTIPFPNLE